LNPERGHNIERRPSMGFVDLHSHVLPGLDDGVQKLEDAAELTSLLAEMGFEIVCATPHQRVGVFVPTPEAIAEAHAEVKRVLDERAIPIKLYLGAENFWDELFLERSQRAEQPTYTGGRAFLVEVSPQLTPPGMEQTLFAMRVRGLLPV